VDADDISVYLFLSGMIARRQTAAISYPQQLSHSVTPLSGCPRRDPRM
jgi:hypothetical protein